MASSQLGAVYEEFQPKLELTETPEAHFLQIHLPGFTMAQVKVRYVTSNKTLSISGEKPEGGNKWSRFSEAIPVPVNCDVNRLSGKFDKGILTITMLKKFTSVTPKDEVAMAEQKPPRAEEPKSEIRENPEAYHLQIYLPGFTKDQVKINYISSSRVISVSGETPIEGGKRWSRFDQAFPAPENFNEERLGAKFDLGILTIIMPKKYTSLVAPKEEVAMAEPGPQQRVEEVIPPSSMTGVEGLKRNSSLLSLEEMDKKAPTSAVYELFQPKSEITENSEAYHVQIHLPGFTRDQVQIKYISSSRVMSVSGERPIEGGNRWIRVDQAYPVPENCDAERVRGKFDQGILTITVPKKFIPQMGKEGPVQKPTRLTLLHEQAVPRTASVEGKHIEYVVDTIGKGFQGVAASASNAVTKIGDGTLNNEEKHLLSVVIAALGAYVSYRVTGSGKPYNY
ncbi:hypothetical protein L6164_023291 [Bauhinia variegata]|uniref:Uncharacterized protein n=1 Tax=Bauhinia variegata TaxID=167791 RepID=A0ACB9MI82_BAUVA|nr:hypothetical protein L6164_023291 [Bauhinia variegata]